MSDITSVPEGVMRRVRAKAMHYADEICGDRGLWWDCIEHVWISRPELVRRSISHLSERWLAEVNAMRLVSQ